MATSSASRRATGFTLIELMVVVLLIGLTLGLALTLDFAESPQHQQQQALAFAAELELAAQEAVLDGAIWGLDFFVTDVAEAQTGYRWLVLTETGWQLPEPASGRQLVAGGVFTGDASVEVDGETLVPEPQIVLDAAEVAGAFGPEIWLLPTRELSPFTLRLADGAGNEVVVSADLLGGVRMNEDAPVLP